MTAIPISLMFLTSTKGHFGFRDVWLSTLNHLDRQIPLGSFRVKIAHIKVTPSEESIASNMADALEQRGFKVIKTVAAWSRGTPHQVGYNQDLITVSKEPSLYDNPHILWLEDDSTISPVSDSLDKVLNRMVNKIDSSPDILSFRFIRAGDFEGGVPILHKSGDFFVSPNFDFQPLLIRSRDFYQAAKIIEANVQAQTDLQIEMLWRLVLNGFSRSMWQHMVWLPEYAKTIHLGTPEYPTLKASLNL